MQSEKFEEVYSDLIIFSKSLEKIMLKLEELEKNNQTNSKEYNELAELPSEVIHIMIKKLNSLYGNTDLLNEITHRLHTLYDINILDNDNISQCFNEDYPYTRAITIFNLVQEYILTNDYVKHKNLNSLFIEMYGKNAIFDTNILNEEQKRIDEITKEENIAISVRNNIIYNQLLDEINNEINKNNKFKNSLIDLKYKLILSSSNLCFGLKLNPNKITRTTILKEIVKIKSKEDKDLYSDLYELEIFNEIENKIKEISLMSMTNLDTYDYEFKLLCNKIYIKTLSSLIYSTEIKRKINKEIKNYLDVSFTNNTDNILNELIEITNNKEKTKK